MDWSEVSNGVMGAIIAAVLIWGGTKVYRFLATLRTDPRFLIGRAAEQLAREIAAAESIRTYAPRAGSKYLTDLANQRAADLQEAALEKMLSRVQYDERSRKSKVSLVFAVIMVVTFVGGVIASALGQINVAAWIFGLFLLAFLGMGITDAFLRTAAKRSVRRTIERARAGSESKGEPQAGGRILGPPTPPGDESAPVRAAEPTGVQVPSPSEVLASVRNEVGDVGKSRQNEAGSKRHGGRCANNQGNNSD